MPMRSDIGLHPMPPNPGVARPQTGVCMGPISLFLSNKKNRQGGGGYYAP